MLSSPNFAQIRHIIAALILSAVWLLTPSASASAQSDTTPPVIVDVTLEPAFVDTSASAQVITVTAHITDDLSGVEYAALSFAPELGTTQAIGVYFSRETMRAGTSVDGYYQNTMILPRYSAWGRWPVGYLSAGDIVGNDGTHYPGPMGWHFVNRFDSSAFRVFLPFLCNGPWPARCPQP